MQDVVDEEMCSARCMLRAQLSSSLAPAARAKVTAVIHSHTNGCTISGDYSLDLILEEYDLYLKGDRRCGNREVLPIVAKVFQTLSASTVE